MPSGEALGVAAELEAVVEEAVVEVDEWLVQLDAIKGMLKPSNPERTVRRLKCIG